MLSKFSVKKPYTVLVGVVIILVLGFLSIRDMSTDFLPDMEFPYAIVMTTYPGASPEEVETAVTTPVEQAMARINNIKELRSMSNNNMSIVIMEFNDGTDMATTTVDMRESLDQITSYWDDAIGSPTIMKINPDMMPIMVAAIDYDGMDAPGITKKAETDVIPELESVEGVASVSASGEVNERIDVILKQDKIDKMNARVRDALNGKFKDAEKKITKGEKKIKKGKSTLNTQKKKAAGQMAKGQTKLDKAGTKISDGLKEINNQIKRIKAQKKKLLKSEKQIKTAKAQLAKQKAKLKSTISTLEKTKDTLESAKAGIDKLRENEERLKAQIEAAGDAATDELKGALAAVEAQLQVVISTLEKNGVSENDLDAKIKEVSSGLSKAKSGLEQIKKQEKKLASSEKSIKKAKKQIDKGLKKLKSMKKKLTSGEITTDKALEELNKQQILASIEMSVAQAGLNSGEQEIKKAKSEFKSTKKSTKESTDLNKLLTKEMIEGILKAENFDMPAGYVAEDDASYLVRVGDKLTSKKDANDLIILDLDIEGLDAIRLSDVADVVVTDNVDDVYTVVNGNPAVSVTMQKQSGFSTGDVTDALLERFKELEKEQDGLSISVLMNQGVYIDLVTDAVGQNLIYGGILAVVILLLFLRDIRPTIIVACSIPLSLVAAVVAMYFSGVTLNIISLSGLALGVGMLVDNSVVVIENIYRMRQEGASFIKAAEHGASEVGGAIISSTLTTVCVFAPIIFTDGITKQLFVDLGLTLAYTLAASLIIALSLVPAMSAGMLRKQKSKESKILSAIQDIYAKSLRPVLRFKPVTLVLAVLLLVLFAYLAVQRGTSMFPDMQSTQMTISVTTDEDKDFEETKDLADQVMDQVLTIPDIEKVGAYAGGSSFFSSFTGGSEHSVTMYVILKEDRELSNAEIRDKIAELTDDIDCEVETNTSAMDLSSLTGEGIRVNIKGRNLDKLTSISEDIMKKLEEVDGLSDISNGLEDAGKEYRITINKAKAMRYSLTVAQVYDQIRKKVAEATSASKISNDTDDYEVFVKSKKDEGLTRKKIDKLSIEYTDAMTQKVKHVKLQKIASFKTALSPDSINRKAQSRYVSVQASIDDDKIVSDVSRDVKTILDSYDMPDGYTIEYDGENEATEEAIGQVMLMLLLAVVFMYLIMVAQFQSLLSPFIILFTIPLAFTGGFMGLFISGNDVSVISLIGFVMLSGIIVNNGIVLVDYTNTLKDGGMEKRDALVEAGRTRLRPILMTALTTVLGLIPMVVSSSMGSDMSRPMAIVVIGGLIYGTLLTLYVVPCMYDILNRKKTPVLTDGDRVNKENDTTDTSEDI